MKIITKGELPDTKPYRATCRKCSTVFEFFRGEAVYESDQRDGDFLRITCPLSGCKESVTVKA